MSQIRQIHSEEVLDGRLVVNVYRDGHGRLKISLGSLANKSGSMNLSPLELASLLDGPLQRALDKANEEDPTPPSTAAGDHA